MKQITALCVLILAGAVATSAIASDTYKVQVTRVSQDIYKVEGQSIYIKTAFCYEFAMSETAILDLTSQPFSGSIDIGKIIFTNGSTTCQVDTILK